MPCGPVRSSVNCPSPGSTNATTNWQEAVRLEKELIRAARQGSLPPQSHSIKLFAAVDDYLEAKKATANTQRAIEFDRERLDVEALQAMATARGRREDAHRVRRRACWSRTDGRGAGARSPPQRATRSGSTSSAQRSWRRTLQCAVEVKHVRRMDFDAKKHVVHIRTSKNETSKRVIPLNDSAFEAVERMVRRADTLGHMEPEHYLWCASQFHNVDPSKTARKWDTAGAPCVKRQDCADCDSTICGTRLLACWKPGSPITS